MMLKLMPSHLRLYVWFFMLGKKHNLKYIDLLPFLIKLLGKLIMRNAVIDNTSVPINSSRKPSHSFAA